MNWVRAAWIGLLMPQLISIELRLIDPDFPIFAMCIVAIGSLVVFAACLDRAELIGR